MSYYKKHIFFCVNQREVPKKCCNEIDAVKFCDYAKQKIKQMELNGRGRIRISSAGCLGRCAQGPLLVIYPEGVWYTYQTIEDIDEIIEKHIVQEELIERLLLIDECV